MTTFLDVANILLPLLYLGAAISYGFVFFASHPTANRTATPTLRIQALGRSTDDNQEALDTRLSETLAELVLLLSEDPSAGTSDNADMQVFRAYPTRWEYRGGILDGNLRAASIDVDIEVHARIMLERS